ncbi:hypothetical protein GCM10010915_26690 [Microbacterium faecale]|uniref:Uncharacterized protein n=1 Tax=Microbacterium faecale TaxID=1804630 RepID=A0A916YGC9_9MICO|nr:hypothetical protein [Microbacterium faecale]GGD44171.1 hypothetical protein GCM10010915_26690 [Microbacterium faecale]
MPATACLRRTSREGDQGLIDDREYEGRVPTPPGDVLLQPCADLGTALPFFLAPVQDGVLGVQIEQTRDITFAVEMGVVTFEVFDVPQILNEPECSSEGVGTVCSRRVDEDRLPPVRQRVVPCS